MKKFAFVLAVAMALASGIADARGGGSSGGGHGGGGGHASSAGSRGGFSSSGGGSRAAAAPAPSRPSTPAAPAAAPRTTTTTTTTTSTYRSQYVSPGPMYGGFGMGYGYSNGLLTGMIIGNMMHPHNTVVYTGGGTYNNNALLYPDGRVVDSRGYQVGVYQNGVFTAVNGGMVAQAVPADAGHQQVQPQPVVIQQAGMSVGEVIGIIFLVLACIFMFVILLGLMV